MGASGATARPLDRAERSSKSSALGLRLVSALVMAPPAVAAMWAGPPWRSALVVAAAGLMGWEWARLWGRGSLGRIGVLVILAGVAAVLTAAMGASLGGIGIALLGAVAALAVALAERAGEPLWVAAGMLWLTLPCIAFLWIGEDPVAGRSALLWLLAVVWATDIGAYAAGRSIGGPRLAPRLSPNKTWAGFAGGLASAALVGAVAAPLTGAATPVLVPASMGLSIMAQLGDLAESLAKRHFGVKDSSGLVPGHGGLLDRLDSLLTAAAALGGATLLAGASPLMWH